MKSSRNRSFKGCRIAPDRSVQLPTGSASSTSARSLLRSFPAARISPWKLQQKQLPPTSPTLNPFRLRRAVSTRPGAWSFVMSPTRFPRASRMLAAAPQQGRFSRTQKPSDEDDVDEIPGGDGGIPLEG